VDEEIRCMDDILRMLDSMLRDEGKWWDGFYEDPEKPIPFFINAPDENLVEYFQSKRMTPGRALELGCGPGRNAIYMARQGCKVGAIDFSETAIQWARERAAEAGVRVNFTHGSIFEFAIEEGAYDIVYECGCLHHIPPHRRMDYVSLVMRALRPGGMFALVCFRDGCRELGGGAEISDWEVYRQRNMKGGLAYSKERLLSLFADAFEPVELRIMREIEQPGDVFGKDFLWVGLFERR
jgi:SAM-dependent methyltransferase